MAGSGSVRYGKEGQATMTETYFLTKLREIFQAGKGVDKIMQDLTKLTADVQAEVTVANSAITLLTGLKSALDAAIAASATDPTALATLSSQLEAETSALSAAVAANTPAAAPTP